MFWCFHTLVLCESVCVCVCVCVCVFTFEWGTPFDQVALQICPYGQTGILGLGRSPLVQPLLARGVHPCEPLEQCDMHFGREPGLLPQDHPGSGVVASCFRRASCLYVLRFSGSHPRCAALKEGFIQREQEHQTESSCFRVHTHTHTHNHKTHISPHICTPTPHHTTLTPFAPSSPQHNEHLYLTCMPYAGLCTNNYFRRGCLPHTRRKAIPLKPDVQEAAHLLQCSAWTTQTRYGRLQQLMTLEAPTRQFLALFGSPAPFATNLSSSSSSISFESCKSLSPKTAAFGKGPRKEMREKPSSYYVGPHGC